jgi:large subunit ribosomal protein L13
MKNELDRNIHTIDADGKSPGRLATQAVGLLMGKHKASFAPNVDGGDHVQVINASKMKIIGKRLEQKQYFHHTAFASGLRTTSMKKVWADNPGDVLVRAVSRMLPKNSHRNERLKRLVVKN